MDEYKEKYMTGYKKYLSQKSREGLTKPNGNAIFKHKNIKHTYLIGKEGIAVHSLHEEILFFYGIHRQLPNGIRKEEG